MAEWGPYAAIAIGAIATYIWRALGVALSGRMRERSPVFDWVGCIAYALIAGLVARMIVFPVGPLHDVGLAPRLGAALAAVFVFYAGRRNLLLGVAAGAVLLTVFAQYFTV
jgi:branched-subunit amino acid transport protein